MPPIADVQAILQRRRFTELIGATEDLWFEVKENHEFNLQGNQNHRIELSKDVSALANSEGGYLLIGLRTEPVAAERTDRVSALDLLTAAEFNAGQFQGVIREYVYPAIQGLVVEFLESAETAGRGIGCIYVPLQEADRQPFLMKHVVDGDDVEFRQIVFGVARREGSSNVPRTFEQLHLALRQGKDSTAARMTRIEENIGEIRRLMTTPPAAGPALPAAADALEDRIEELLGDD